MRQPDKPWIALGISRATWYRLGKPADKYALPRSRRQAALAPAVGMSVRSFQRLRRLQREAPDLFDEWCASRLKLGRAEAFLIWLKEEMAKGDPGNADA
jgi:hypothetical protein